jgi:hypothetical protein
MMDMSTPAREQAVADLVRLRRPLAEAITSLRRFPWDSDEELVELGPADLRRVLDRCLAGDLSAEQLEDWANAVESREDIAFEPRDVIDLVAELANPTLFRPLTQETVRDLVGRVDALVAGP